MCNYITMLRLLSRLPRHRAPRASPALTRLFATPDTATLPNFDANAPQTAPQNDPQDDTNTPWYLRDSVTNTLADERTVELPAVPAHAPPAVAEFLRLAAHDYGMDNVMLFDMTRLDDTHEFRRNNNTVDFVVVATGKSEKHVFAAASQLRAHLKHAYDVVPVVEGLVSTASTPAMRRRLAKRARKGPMATDSEYGKAANSWVLCHHDGVDLHLMTAQRRAELNLELVWCADSERHMYEPAAAAPADSDSIFLGIRRLHTSTRPTTRVCGAQVRPLSTHLASLHALPDYVSADTLAQHLARFEASFRGSSLADHSVRFHFLKAVHVLRPAVVPFADVENALLAKYAAPCALGDVAAEKIADVAEYAKLLLDSPEYAAHDKHTSDVVLDKLARFIATLYAFSADRFQMAANAHFIPLLWRMTHAHVGTPVAPKHVDDVLQQQLDVAAVPEQTAPAVALAANNARDVLYLVDHYTRTEQPGLAPTAALRELVLFTYGNAGKWPQFWREWDARSFARAVEPAVAVERWVRLAVFLALVGNRELVLYFFNHYWRSSSAVGGLFVESFDANERTFNSDNEKLAFKAAVRKMAAMFDTDAKQPFEHIKAFVEQIN